MPSYENEPDEANEDDDNGLPMLAGLATDAEVGFLERMGGPVQLREAEREISEIARRIDVAHAQTRQMSIRLAKSKYERSWWFGGVWCGLTVFHVALMAFGSANAFNVAMLVAVSIVAGYQVRDITISHDEYTKELEQGEAW